MSSHSPSERGHLGTRDGSVTHSSLQSDSASDRGVPDSGNGQVTTQLTPPPPPASMTMMMVADAYLSTPCEASPLESAQIVVQPSPTRNQGIQQPAGDFGILSALSAPVTIVAKSTTDSDDTESRGLAVADPPILASPRRSGQSLYHYQSDWNATPVTRNTTNIMPLADSSPSDEEQDLALFLGDSTAKMAIVSPTEDSHDGDTHDGSHYLKFSVPSSKGGFQAQHLKQRSRRSSSRQQGQSRPPVAFRAKSMGTLDLQNSAFAAIRHFADRQDQPTKQEPISEDDLDADKERNENLTPFSLDRNYHSFTGPSEYRRQLWTKHHCNTNGSTLDNLSQNENHNEDSPEVAYRVSSIAESPTRRQYQPRRDSSLVVGKVEVDQDVLSSIFKNGSPLRTTMHPNDSDCRSSLNPATALGHQHHDPVPMDDRQWSIPSLRLANHLRQDSLASYTCSEFSYDDHIEDEEDNLFLASKGETLTDAGYSLNFNGFGAGSFKYDGDAAYEEDASISTCESAWPAQQDNSLGDEQIVSDSCLVVGNLDKILAHETRLEDDSVAAVAPTSAPTLNSTPSWCPPFHVVSQPSQTRQDQFGARTSQSLKKVLKREQERKALKWLKTVEVSRDNDYLAEAASSKFLTGVVSQPPGMMNERLYSRGNALNNANNASMLSSKRCRSPLSAEIALNRHLSSPPDYAVADANGGTKATVKCIHLPSSIKRYGVLESSSIAGKEVT